MVILSSNLVVIIFHLQEQKVYSPTECLSHDPGLTQGSHWTCSAACEWDNYETITTCIYTYHHMHVHASRHACIYHHMHDDT